jgi:hypothetical protein
MQAQVVGQGSDVDDDVPFYIPAARRYEEMTYKRAASRARDMVQDADQTRAHIVDQLREAAADRILGVDGPDSVFEELEAAEARYANLSRRWVRGYDVIADDLGLRPASDTRGTFTPE